MLILLTDGSVVDLSEAVDAIQTSDEIRFLSAANDVLATLEVPKVLAYTFNPRVAETLKQTMPSRSLHEALCLPVTDADLEARGSLPGAFDSQRKRTGIASDFEQ